MHAHVSIFIVSDTDNIHSNKVKKKAILSILFRFIPFYSMILTVSSRKFAFCFVKKRLAHNQSRSVPKTSLNASLHGFIGIGNHMCT